MFNSFPFQPHFFSLPCHFSILRVWLFQIPFHKIKGSLFWSHSQPCTINESTSPRVSLCPPMVSVQVPAPEEKSRWVVDGPLLKLAIPESTMSTKAVSKLINNCQARGKAESRTAILKAHQRLCAKSRADERCGRPLRLAHAHTQITHAPHKYRMDDGISKLQTERDT